MWEFWIDVGGTFTDCLAVSPDGDEHFIKVLSSGKTKGAVARVITASRFVDPVQLAPVDDFWVGSKIEFLRDDGSTTESAQIIRFDAQAGEFELDRAILDSNHSTNYELDANLLAPVLAIHQIQRVPILNDPQGCRVDLGTTRGTNALLTRTGAPTGLITSRGFRDFLRIGDQARPKLFELAIHKSQPLFATSIEVDERVLFDGTVERVPDEVHVQQQLRQLKEQGIESVAICFMFGYLYPQHEQMVAEVAEKIGFRSVQTSSATAPLIKMVPRAETTVLDGYLNPVITSYLDEMQSQLSPRSRLRFMTSGGGLVTRSRFSGKDSVLSGPAGGVVGAARIAEQAGFQKVIGFDMGGTSTDVSRFEGMFERTFETRKAGVRIVTPMLEVETVAAGGGSICWFDGTRLQVGPDSAGANPGPACYGRGGPLAVTDINLFLGRIQQDWFPFELDLQAVDHRLSALSVEMKKAGFDYDPHELADGFLRIANNNMSSAIQTVSVAKGYDPRDYVLLSFGGAGSQHACAVAENLNMKQILDHPQRSILSAVGIRLADQASHAVAPVSDELSADALQHLQPVWDRLTERVTSSLVDEGSEPNCISLSRSLDLRYVGTEPNLCIPEPLDGDFKTAFQRLHQQQYGYLQQKPIEITAARVDGVVKGDPLPKIEIPKTFAERSSDKRQRVWHAGAWVEAAVFERSDLVAGDSISGPATISDRHSTTVVDPDWQAKVLPQGFLLIEKRMTAVKASPPAKEDTGELAPDPVQLEIFNSHFSSIAEQMGFVLQRTSCSVNVKERLDFSCAIFTKSGSLVVNAPHIPVHLGAMSETVRSVIALNTQVHPGDVFVTNDPYAGGSHLPDVTVVTPVFDPGSDELWFWVASRSHHAEIGGLAPGSMPANATKLGQEGVLIQNFRLIEGSDHSETGAERDSNVTPRQVVEHFEELRQILTTAPYPSRSPDENLADIRAQIAANQQGLNRLRSLVERYSFKTVEAFMDQIQTAAELKTRAALRKLPDGSFRFQDSMDNGNVIRVQIEKRDDSLKVDFEGTDPVADDNLNANRAIVSAATMYVMRCLIEEDIPLNEGVMKPVEIYLPACFLNPSPTEDPYNRPAIVGGNVETSQRVVDVLLGALHLAAASQGTMNNWLMGDASFGYYETLGGGSGATSTASGASAVHTHMTNTRLTDPEILESRFPVIMRVFSIREGSGGSGQYRGGDGMVREFEFRRPVTVSLLTSRRNCQPYGAAGGAPGASGKNILIRAHEPPEDLPSRCEIQMESSDRLRIETPGGGGWGEDSD